MVAPTLLATVKEKAIESLMVDTMLQLVRLPLCITDPELDDNPIVYVNDAFCDMTGYSREEVVGRNCRFLQGVDTTPHSIARVRTIIADGRTDTVEIINYRKDGTKFLNALQIGPVCDATGRIVLYFGSQTDVTEKRAEEGRLQALATEELLHRLRNIINVMSSVIRMSSKEVERVDEFADLIVGRLAALGQGHFQAFADSNQAVETKTLLRAVVTPYAPLGASQIEIVGDGFLVRPQAVTALSLLIHELSTNAVKYGALGTTAGRVTVTCDADFASGTGRLRWVEAGGPPVTPPSRLNGTSITGRLLERSGGEARFAWPSEGAEIEVILPIE